MKDELIKYAKTNNADEITARRFSDFTLFIFNAIKEADYELIPTIEKEFSAFDQLKRCLNIYIPVIGHGPGAGGGWYNVRSGNFMKPTMDSKLEKVLDFVFGLVNTASDLYLPAKEPDFLTQGLLPANNSDHYKNRYLLNLNTMLNNYLNFTWGFEVIGMCFHKYYQEFLMAPSHYYYFNSIAEVKGKRHAWLGVWISVFSGWALAKNCDVDLKHLTDALSRYFKTAVQLYGELCFTGGKESSSYAHSVANIKSNDADVDDMMLGNSLMFYFSGWPSIHANARLAHEVFPSLFDENKVILFHPSFLNGFFQSASTYYQKPWWDIVCHSSSVLTYGNELTTIAEFKKNLRHIDTRNNAWPSGDANLFWHKRLVYHHNKGILQYLLASINVGKVSQTRSEMKPYTKPQEISNPIKQSNSTTSLGSKNKVKYSPRAYLIECAGPHDIMHTKEAFNILYGKDEQPRLTSFQDDYHAAWVAQWINSITSAGLKPTFVIKNLANSKLNSLLDDTTTEKVDIVQYEFDYDRLFYIIELPDYELMNAWNYHITKLVTEDELHDGLSHFNTNEDCDWWVKPNTKKLLELYEDDVVLRSPSLDVIITKNDLFISSQSESETIYSYKKCPLVKICVTEQGDQETIQPNGFIQTLPKLEDLEIPNSSLIQQGAFNRWLTPFPNEATQCSTQSPQINARTDVDNFPQAVDPTRRYIDSILSILLEIKKRLYPRKDGGTNWSIWVYAASACTLIITIIVIPLVSHKMGNTEYDAVIYSAPQFTVERSGILINEYEVKDPLKTAKLLAQSLKNYDPSLKLFWHNGTATLFFNVEDQEQDAIQQHIRKTIPDAKINIGDNELVLVGVINN